jgi:hypothetical protein
VIKDEPEPEVDANETLDENETLGYEQVKQVLEALERKSAMIIMTIGNVDRVESWQRCVWLPNGHLVTFPSAAGIEFAGKTAIAYV